MITGKVSQAVQDRSVDRILSRAGAAGIPGNLKPALKASRQTCSSGTLGGAWDRTADMILSDAAGQLLAAQIKPELFMISLMLPSDMPEEALRDLIRELAESAGALNAVIGKVDCMVSQAVERPVLQAVCTGTVRVTSEEKTGQPNTPKMLVMAGSPGLGGASMLCGKYEAQLKDKLPLSMVRETAGRIDCVHLTTIRRVLEQEDPRTLQSMWSAGTGGVFAALWLFAQQEHCGFDVNLRAMPVRQEIIEICETMNIHPYRLNAQGVMLMISTDAKGLCRRLTEAGVRAAVIGEVTGNCVVIRNGDEMRYLEKPQQEELDRLQDGTAVRP